ncbi:hypothetical protein K2X14_01725 [Acetobacter sp. TBRC 12305]|uniref:Lipoprotein n=1 Tax=Acetobacter garciniae TaxID=2817435 RepID=A0A939HKS1_9PROT|nr:hypothetical protein [Acetobacter garciniae]MBO1323871.1 hypothetical protein [Acetobacter garciniae]MBX0343560.1 hypothetical protein [Acetobacter garciniae]
MKPQAGGVSLRVLGALALVFTFCAFGSCLPGREGVGLGGVAHAADGGAANVCLAPQAAAPTQVLVVVPSGTVFTAQQWQRRVVPQRGNTHHHNHTRIVLDSRTEGFVTTETVTLTHMQPCAQADAASVVSHTRHWLVAPVNPVADPAFHAVGEISGNGLDTKMVDEETSFRTLARSGQLQASVTSALNDTVYLQEGPADMLSDDSGDAAQALPDNATPQGRETGQWLDKLPDIHDGDEAADDLPGYAAAGASDKKRQ